MSISNLQSLQVNLGLQKDFHNNTSLFKYQFCLINYSKIMTQTSSSFKAASWIALAVGFLGFIVGIWNAEMLLNEKGYYIIILFFGLFAVVSLQKSVRDKMEGLPVTDIYYGLCWFTTVLSAVLLIVGLWNAVILPSEKGYYVFAFVLGMFGAIAIQKNTRDAKAEEISQS